MPISSEAPLRLPADMKEKVQLAAAILGLKQAEFVSEAVEEYLVNHAGEVERRLAGAQKKLRVDKNGQPGTKRNGQSAPL